MQTQNNNTLTSCNFSGVDKFDGSFSKEESGCTIVINETVNSIKNLNALGLYSYLICRPPNWRVNVKQLTRNFDCNKEKIYNLIDYLIDMNLLTRTIIRDKGKFSEYHYRVHFRPVLGIVSNLEKYDSPCLEKPDTEKPDTVNPDTYITKNIKIKEDNNKDLVDFKKSPKSKKVNLKDYKKDPRFMRFYDPYPKKEKPREAYKAFLSIVGDDDELLERIVVDIELRKEKHEQWQDIQYISHPATYLRSEEFNGEIYDHKKRKAYNSEHQEKNKAERDKEAKEAQDALIKKQDEASRLKQQSARTSEKRRVEISNQAESAIDSIKKMIT